MHRDHVPEVPTACRLLASTPVAMNQGFIRYPPHHPLPDSVLDISLKDIQIFTVQGHPEFTKSIVDTIVDAREAAGVFDKATAEGARERSTWRNDGVSVIAKVIWGVLGVAPETS
ncbi:hypothetical protein PHLCEN_2v7416 [Hermanssonia centrifuga]|uniref:Uncharacterized protein n=1 Tax=Hermanssonia centrifuga TaxID=98765 RepID=A0A2R6NWK9_9APHY|nr:hypothetical protein PHLCEN_2v7416 [Hermanssonia centrifuga]